MPNPTFPGVYTQVIDQSFLPPQISRFRPGLVGVTTKGPMNVPTVVRSLKDFIKTFGAPVAAPSQDSSVEYYLADAVALVAEYTNTVTVIRVGNTATDLPTVSAAGTKDATTIDLSAEEIQILTDLRAAAPAAGDLWVTLKQEGKSSTINAKITSFGTATATLDKALTDTYTGADVQYSKVANAASTAEGVLKSRVYGSALTALGEIHGNKNAFEFTVSSNGSNVPIGSYLKIGSATGKETTEVKVKMVVNGTAYLETTDDTRTGYKALGLQDTYDASNPGILYSGTAVQNAYFLEAKSSGEWANGVNSTTGLFVRVLPGSAPGSKRLEVYENGGLVEVFDNVEKGAYATALASSQYMTLVNAASNAEHAANTVAPWDTTLYDEAVNAGRVTTATEVFNTGGQFTGGANGNNATEVDYCGQYDAVEDRYTGIRAFEDENVDVNIIAAPMDFNALSGTNLTKGMAVLQQLADTAKAINAVAIADVPDDLNPAAAVDWHNGVGAYAGRGRLDRTNLAIYWNWWQMIDKFTRQSKWLPPSLAALRCFGFTFQRDQPWYAAAGETRGWVPEAMALRYERVSADAKSAMYGNGNSVNPLLRIRNSFYIYGERTMQRAESKLTAIHSVILVNTVVKGLAAIGRQFIFDPNDLELLIHIRLAYSEYLDKIRNQRGVEEYELVVDDRNNTADTRNRREVIVDLALIPTDVAERIFINATVRESGAQLNTVTV